MTPQLDVGGFTPRPRNERPASAPIAYPNASAAWTMTGDTTFGNTCLRSMRLSETPTDLAASTNVSSRTASTCDRMTRTSPGTKTMAMASDALVRLAPRSAEIARANVSGGNVNNASMQRSMIPPSHPPKKPDDSPSTSATLVAIVTTRNATNIDDCAP